MRKVLHLIRNCTNGNKRNIAESVRHNATKNSKNTLKDNPILVLNQDQFLCVKGHYEYHPQLALLADKWLYPETVLKLRNGANVIIADSFHEMALIKAYLYIKELIPNLEIIVSDVQYLDSSHKDCEKIPSAYLEMYDVKYSNIKV